MHIHAQMMQSQVKYMSKSMKSLKIYFEILGTFKCLLNQLINLSSYLLIQRKPLHFNHIEKLIYIQHILNEYR